MLHFFCQYRVSGDFPIRYPIRYRVLQKRPDTTRFPIPDTSIGPPLAVIPKVGASQPCECAKRDGIQTFWVRMTSRGYWYWNHQPWKQVEWAIIPRKRKNSRPDQINFIMMWCSDLSFVLFFLGMIARSTCFNFNCFQFQYFLPVVILTQCLNPVSFGTFTRMTYSHSTYNCVIKTKSKLTIHVRMEHKLMGSCCSGTMILRKLFIWIKLILEFRYFALLLQYML